MPTPQKTSCSNSSNHFFISILTCKHFTETKKNKFDALPSICIHLAKPREWPKLCSQGEAPLWTWGSCSIEPSRSSGIQLSQIRRAKPQLKLSPRRFERDYEKGLKPLILKLHSVFCHRLLDDPDLQLRTASLPSCLVFLKLSDKANDSQRQCWKKERMGFAS